MKANVSAESGSPFTARVVGATTSVASGTSGSLRADYLGGGSHVARRALGLGGAHVQQLRRVVPFVEGFAQLQAVVALQAQQLALQRDGERLGELGLADAGLAFQQQRALQLSARKTAVARRRSAK